MYYIHIIIVLVVVGFLLGLVNRFIPMASAIKSILNILVVMGVLLWTLQALGLIPPIAHFMDISGR